MSTASRLSLVGCVGLSGLAAPTLAQVSFTIDNHGPTIAVPDAFSAVAITEGDLLTTLSGGPGVPGLPMLGAPPPPGIMISGGAGASMPGPGLGLVTHLGCVGHLPGTLCPIEVDAISYGRDFPLPNGPTPPGTYWFSVDEYATGVALGNPAPDVFSEGALGAELEASADTFIDLGAPPPALPMPYPPGAFPVPGNVGAIDGDGLPNTSGIAYPGVGIVEPDPPRFPPMIPPDGGDNQDGVDVDDAQAGFPVYFSLDAAHPDPINVFPLTGAAPANGFFPGDVLVTMAPGGPPVVFAPAVALGMDFPIEDDLDALILWENGSGVFEPSLIPYDWLGGATDMLLFSVRRGSPVIGLPDSLLGIPIEAGDILTTPLPMAMGGVSPYPGIFLAAENLGLATKRANPGLNFGDDLDALDAVQMPVFDCNANGIEDAYEISSGVASDINKNGIPDDCELLATPYCFCPSAVAICGNPDPNAGCSHSAGVGCLLGATGTSSVTNDDMFLVGTQAPTNKSGLFFFGPSQVNAPFGDGRRCVGGMTQRLFPILNSGGSGTFVLGPVASRSALTPNPILPGSTWNFQCWFRDPMGPCGNGFNLSNGLSVQFTP